MIYLDNAATTSLLPEVLSSMLPFLSESFGNASSVHPLGLSARRAIEQSRQIIADSINASPEEIYFTSGATESNNWMHYMYKDKHTFVSSIEHPSMYTSNFNSKLIYVPVDPSGFVTQSTVEQFLYTYMPDLISVMLVNNEIGTIEPIHDIGMICKKYNQKKDTKVYLHVDATQGYCHVPIDVKKDNITYLSASAHKVHGPKGIGFLYVSKDSPFNCCRLLKGGMQENGLRAGTENVAGIVGFGTAVQKSLETMEETEEHLRKLRQYMHYQVMNNISDVMLNGACDFSRRISNNLNYMIKGVKGSDLVEVLGENYIYCSAGSACHSGSNEPSHVLKAIGLTTEEANQSVRFSLGPELQKEDIDIVIKNLIFAVESLRKYGDV